MAADLETQPSTGGYLVPEGHGGIIPVIYNDDAPLISPFIYTSPILVIERTIAQISLNVPSTGDLASLGSASWYCYWNGEQDLIFIPNDANTLLNGVSAPVTFTASAKRTLILIISHDTGYEIHDITTSPEPSTPPSIIGFSQRSATNVWTYNTWTTINTSNGVVLTNEINDFTWANGGVVGDCRWEYIGLTTKTFNLVASVVLSANSPPPFDDMKISFEVETPGGNVEIARAKSAGLDYSLTLPVVTVLEPGDFLQLRSEYGGSDVGNKTVTTYVSLSITSVCC